VRGMMVLVISWKRAGVEVVVDGGPWTVVRMVNFELDDAPELELMGMSEKKESAG
jgi:hypothetical protein